MKELKERRYGKSEEGMTLMELIIVLVILGLLTAVIGSGVYGKLSQGRGHVAKIHIGELDGALEIYSFDMGRYPTTSEGLQALVQNPVGVNSWNGPYLKKGLQPDPWGRPLLYKSPGTHGDYDICSMGPDGIEGTDDDICNWNQ